MYRTNDPRFRRRLNEIGQTLENANESAQSNLYIFGQTYIKPCLDSVGACINSCVDASCPSLNFQASQRERRLRRQRGRSRGRAELSFDFYDDWDEDESDALLGWGSDELVAGGTAGGTYGSTTVTHAQPARQKSGMKYPKSGRALPHDPDSAVVVVPGSSIFGKLFGGKALRYKPSAAGLQEHPGKKRQARNSREVETLLEGQQQQQQQRPGYQRTGPRARSGTATSAETTDSYSSRGDIFPSDEEDDAVPLDDEFAMVLERRTSHTGGSTPGPDTEGSSTQTMTTTRSRERLGSKRPSAGSRVSSNRTVSSRSSQSGKKGARSRPPSAALLTSRDEVSPAIEDSIHSISELKVEDRAAVSGEAAETERLGSDEPFNAVAAEELSSKEATPRSSTPQPASSVDELSKLPTPLPIDDEAEQTIPHSEEVALNEVKS